MDLNTYSSSSNLINSDDEIDAPVPIFGEFFKSVGPDGILKTKNFSHH